uniref:M20/M25/M40 family metallo-hydrolase n=1 Tax=Schlesneria paludicola TaxID=360056 RepID=A0A7C4LM63_9PLAN
MSLPELLEDRAVENVLRLLRIPGRSREEGRILAEIQQLLQEGGVPATAMEFDRAHEQIPGGGEVGNLIVQLPGTLSGPRRLLMAHVDTVPICVGADPVVEGDRIRSRNPHSGLGGDDRAGAAVLVTTLLELVRQGLPHPPLTFLFCVQEEIGLYGARYCSLEQLGRPAWGFNWDGDDPAEICVGATGDYALEIAIEGVASHAGVHPELGVSAAAIAALAVADLQRRGWHGLIEKRGQRGTSNVGVIEGGAATNVVMPLLKLRAEARSHNPRFRKRIVEQYRRAFEKAAAKVKSADGKTGRVTFSAELKYEAFRLPDDSPAVAIAAQAVSALGLSPQTCVANGGLDANWMVAHGVPTVTLGCGQDEIHTVRESLSIPSYLTGCRLGLLIATGAAEQSTSDGP